VVNIKNIKELEGIRKTRPACASARCTMEELATNAHVRAGYKSLGPTAAAADSQPAYPQHGQRWAATCAGAPLL